MSRALIDQAFSGHGVALRREDEPPIPGEPFISMSVAKEICSRLLSSTPALDDRERFREALERLERANDEVAARTTRERYLTDLGDVQPALLELDDARTFARSALASIRSGDAG